MSETGEPTKGRAALEMRFPRLARRIVGAERNEEKLAERIRNARSDSVVVVRSTERLTNEFPDVLMADPSDGSWVLRPLAAHRGDQWDVRRRTIVETEVPTLGKAIDTAALDSEHADAQRARLPPRQDTARHGRIAAPEPERPIIIVDNVTGWRRWFKWLHRTPAPAQRAARPAADTVISLGDVANQIAEMVAAGREAQRQQAEFQACLTEMQRLTRRLDTLDVRSAG